MSALSDAQMELLRAAERGALTVTQSSRFFIDGIEVDETRRWVASDLLGDDWLFLPAVSPRKFRPVHPSAKAVTVLCGGAR